MLNESKYHILVASIQQEVIGFIGLQECFAFEVSREILRILALAVSKRYQNRKGDSALIQAIKQYAKKHGIMMIVLIVDW